MFLTKYLSLLISTVISALELTSNNVLCGSVRLIYAVIYTFFLVSLNPSLMAFSHF